MTPIHRVLDQIRWDERLSRCRFELAWRDRASGLVREPVAAFRARGEVPLHRVERLWCDGRLVWDRESKLDEIDRIATEIASRSKIVSAAFWNVQEPQGERVHALVEAIVALRADVTGLCEVTQGLLDALAPKIPADRVLLSAGSLALIAPSDRSWSTTALPLPGREALLAAGEDLTVAVAHLTSDIRGDRSVRRTEQLTALMRALPPHGALLVMLDANTERELTELDPLQLVDPGSDPTFDPESNPLARSNNPQPRRLDRILVRGLLSRAGEVVRHSPALSDHYALRLSLTDPPESERFGRSTAAALAILLPADLAQQIDAIRAGRDEACPRWPAHITLKHPFVAQEQLASVLPQLALALATVQPLRVALPTLDRFEHGGGRYTVWARPSDMLPLRALRQRIDDLLPHLLESTPYTPHLTLASGSGRPPEIAWPSGVSFVAEGLALLSREGGSFRVVDAVPFGAGDSLQQAMSHTGLLDREPGPDLLALLEPLLPGALTLVGSAASGLRLAGGDIDIVWDPPEELPEPRALARQVLARYAPREIETRSAPRLKLSIDGLEVDLLFGPSLDAVEDARRARMASPEQRLAILALKIWSLRRSLSTPASVGWLDLVLASPDGPAEEILAAIWRRLASPSDELVLAGPAFRSAKPADLSQLRREARDALAMCDHPSPAWRAIFRA